MLQSGAEGSLLLAQDSLSGALVALKLLDRSQVRVAYPSPLIAISLFALPARGFLLPPGLRTAHDGPVGGHRTRGASARTAIHHVS